jgi:hypothetical protein
MCFAFLADIIHLDPIANKGLLFGLRVYRMFRRAAFAPRVEYVQFPVLAGWRPSESATLWKTG